VKLYQVTVEEIVDKTERIPLQSAQPESVTMTQQALDAAVIELDQVRKHLAYANATIDCLTRDWQPLADWAQGYAHGRNGEKYSAIALDRISDLERENRRLATERDSALGSQKATEAALDVERMHGCWLRNSLELCAKYFGSASVDDLRQHIAKTLQDIDETVGKESG